MGERMDDTGRDAHRTGKDGNASETTSQNRSSYQRGSAHTSSEGSSVHSVIRGLIATFVAMACLLAVALLAFVLLSRTAAFTITTVEAIETEHLDEENIVRLAAVDEGSTLLNMDVAKIKENLSHNPWVQDVTLHRHFPGRLTIEIQERKARYVVKMGTGSVCWYLGGDYVWIEPIDLTVESGESAEMAALAIAQDMGIVLIYDIPASVHPNAGSVATDEVIMAVGAYQEQFSSSFAKQVACYSAASVESIACFLQSGVEVALGSPTSIDVKEAVVKELLENNKDQVTYINVRIPAQPAYRKLDLDNVSEGTGIQIDLTKTELSPKNGEDVEDQKKETQEQDTQEQDTSKMVQGEDGQYYTYEELYGYSYEEYWGLE